MVLIEELAAAGLDADILRCHVVEIYPLRIQLGITTLDGTCYDEAADHFTVAVSSGVFLSKRHTRT